MLWGKASSLVPDLKWDRRRRERLGGGRRERSREFWSLEGQARGRLQDKGPEVWGHISIHPHGPPRHLTLLPSTSPYGRVSHCP